MSVATRLLLFTALASAGLQVAAVPSAARRPPQSTKSTSVPVSTSEIVTISTSVPSPTAPLNSLIPSEAALPPPQSWCPSEVFCAGALIQAVDLAQLFVDSKTFVDKPTVGTANQTLAQFKALIPNGGSVDNITIGTIETFVENAFKGEGLELEAAQLPGFTDNPAFLKNVSDPLVKVWSQTVHGFWAQLARSTNTSVLCTGGQCESTLIPLNHTFVVPGGRFREQYYWDSFFIIEGLIKSELYEVVNNTLSNFMDELELFGFIPNGGRIYYLNRSQPPLFIYMLFNYVQATGDIGILKRALPLAEVELEWWLSNRTFNLTSPYTNVTHAISHYAVDINSAPRPESYLEDYQTVHGAGEGDIVPNFTLAEQADLYAELASGAETGWDYSSRWVKQIGLGNLTFNDPQLRHLNVRNTTPVCLNSMLYNARVRIADLYEMTATQTVNNGPHGKPITTTNQTALSRAKFHRSVASSLRTAILDLFWDPKKLAFYDFNLTSNTRNDLWSTATYYPYWNEIFPDEVLSSAENAFGAFSAVNMVLNKFNGTVPVTWKVTGLQWDAPNAWPPNQYVILRALQNLPSNLTSIPLPLPLSYQSTFDLIPDGQLGVPISQLPQQTRSGGQPFPVGADVNTIDSGLDVLNGGNVTKQEGWASTLTRELSNRYIASAYCNWLATGGSIPGFVDRLPPDQLNITQSLNNTGIMFEKFSITDVDEAGVGGEYTVQAGFGWTNGVVLWIAGEFGHILTEPVCPRLFDTTTIIP